MALCLAAFVTYMGSGMVGTVRILYVQSRGGSLAVISAMAAAFLIANFCAQYPWAWAADRVGKRRVIIAGLVIAMVTSIAYVFITQPWLFVAVRVIEGIGAASILAPARALIADLYPNEQRGRAYGLFLGFFSLGFLFGPAAGGLLATIGFSFVFWLAAGLRVVSAAIVFIGLRGVAERPLETVRSDEYRGSTFRGLTNLGLVGAYIISLGDALWLGFDQTLAPLWMRHHLGASIAMIGITYSAWALPNAIMAPFGGRLADRFSRRRLIFYCGLGQLPMYGLYVVAHSVYPVIAGMLIQAVLYGVVAPAVDAHNSHAAPAHLRTRAQSVYAGMGMFGAFIGACAFTPLYALDYRLPLVVQGGCYGIAILIGTRFIRSWELRSHLGATPIVPIIELMTPSLMPAELPTD
jgi:MFS family permease